MVKYSFHPKVEQLRLFILELAGDKNFIPRAPLRIVYKDTYGNRARHYLHNHLTDLEKHDLIIKHYGYIELLPGIRERTNNEGENQET